jgi:putative ABC transport system permease protein
MRQAVFAVLGLAVGAGLVSTMTIASAGVRHAQSTVLPSRYGAGTDITVTKAHPANPGGLCSFRVGRRLRSFTRLKAGAKFTRSTLILRGPGTLRASAVSSVSALHGVAATGSLIAGGFGNWRAARPRSAAALARVP